MYGQSKKRIALIILKKILVVAATVIATAFIIGIVYAIKSGSKDSR